MIQTFEAIIFECDCRVRRGRHTPNEIITILMIVKHEHGG